MSYLLYTAGLVGGTLWATLTPLTATAVETSEHPPELNFSTHIRPILSRCVGCHGSLEQGGLRLDSREAILRGSPSGPVVVAGDAKQSTLIKMITSGNQAGLRMPLGQSPLTAEQIDLFRAWIDDGLPWPAEEPPLAVTDPRLSHWSFQPLGHAPPPAVNQRDWPRTPIDHYILAKHESLSLAPSPEADRTTIIRRLSLDLTGLPPSPEQVARFIDDTAPGAYERLVDRLLASPHFGERWGRHWLDAARYADSDGYETDGPRPIWKYRDWVVCALNSNTTYHDFVLQQVAGDLLPETTSHLKTATGFVRCGKGGSTPGKRLPITLIDRTNTIGRVFLGLTIGCAQCHSHKFDPISQREYYELFAFFNSSDDQYLEFATPQEKDAHNNHKAETATLQKDLDQYELVLATQLNKDPMLLNTIQQPYDRAILKEILALSPDEIEGSQKAFMRERFREIDEEYRARHEQIESHKAATPVLTKTLILRELPDPPGTHIFIRGVPEQKGPLVEPNVPACLPPLKTTSRANRLDLAKWLCAPDHPLTARVMANRIWQQYFGTGLVETADDFGLNGARPSHPDLLDWLAGKLVQNGYGIKSFHRLIVTSATYRQNSDYRPELQDTDPLNRLLARQSRLRLEAEIIRDQGLAVANLLNPRLEGPSAFPYQVDGIMSGRADRSTWKMDTGPARFRRGMYVHSWRLTPHPVMRAFDLPDAAEACTRRLRSNTPIQALTLLNDHWFTEFAVALADRTLRENANTSDTQKIEHMFHVCLARPPTPSELHVLQRLIRQQHDSLEESPQRGNELVQAISLPVTSPPVQIAIWSAVSRTLLNLDEFITRE
jgi:hypothetical protein